jgi:hypothetical protein
MENNVMERTELLVSFLDKVTKPSEEKETTTGKPITQEPTTPYEETKLNDLNCSATFLTVENRLNYLDNIKHSLLEGMSKTLKLILDYFTSKQDKCNSVKMKTRCMKVMVSRYR